ncbi:hypothetical protein NDU88_005651 [Pleurodeles waltl]|uniref:Secreted protein n=1 Tax=Pleurodeles waltl TaxID=8319 RepID=A0AAV7TBN2_PLEWA|nr:hypothetical protein NDU88_005651 [Pleurodeles waltl]
MAAAGALLLGSLHCTLGVNILAPALCEQNCLRGGAAGDALPQAPPREIGVLPRPPGPSLNLSVRPGLQHGLLLPLCDCAAHTQQAAAVRRGHTVTELCSVGQRAVNLVAHESATNWRPPGATLRGAHGTQQPPAVRRAPSQSHGV